MTFLAKNNKFKIFTELILSNQNQEKQTLVEFHEQKL